MDEQKTNYIELGDDSHGTGNIFNELSGELGELDFDRVSKTERLQQGKNWLLISYQVSGYAFMVTVILSIVFSLNVFIRTAEGNSLYTSLPICPYLSWGVENYENDDCKTLAMISTDSSEERQKKEKTLLDSLAILVPKELQSVNILGSPKVRFIQERTGDSRISITSAIGRFLDIKNRTAYQGEDIECKNIVTNEKGELSISCDVYGGALFSPTRTATHTSREVALEFLERLGDVKQGFQLLSVPKTLDIAAYSSSDVGIKSIFSTHTALDIKLRYLSANKM